MRDSSEYPSELQEAEEALIRTRRGLPAGDPIDRRVGLALSGGGIRSATFCLGFLQSLAAQDILPKVDFMSTVSGGSYMGSFLGRLYTRSGEDDGTAPVKDALKGTHSPQLRWLRDGGRYLVPRGSGDVMLGTSVTIRNWVSLNVAIMSFFVPFFCLLAGLRYRIEKPAFLAENWIWIAAGLFYAAAVVFGVLYWFAPIRAASDALARRRRRLSELLTWGLATGTMAAIVGAIDLAGARSYSWFLQQSDLSAAVSLPLAAVGAFGAAAATRIRGLVALLPEREATSRLPIATLAGIAGIVLFAFALWLYAISAYFIVYGAETPLVSQLETPALSTSDVQLRLTNEDLLQVFTKPPSESDAITTRMAKQESYFMIIRIVCLLAFLIILAYLAGWHCLARKVPFVNSSAMLPMYTARLVRAYLGASNPQRLPGVNGPGVAVTNPIHGDDLPFHDYKPHAARGPLHLIGLTFNETLDGKTQIEQRDRKGLGLSVGPAGISAGTRYHAIWTEDGNETKLTPVAPEFGVFRVFEDHYRGEDGMAHCTPIKPETLTLGRWVGISGAAFSTGMGANSTMGLSFLTGLFNIRMGYWWDSGVEPSIRDAFRVKGGILRNAVGRLNDWLFPAHAQLLAEFFGRFHGPAKRHWYLSDGGHYENTGAYELIRRRVEFIIVCDNGADPDYAFADIANLVRKVRTDFQAEVEFLDRETLDAEVDKEVRPLFGTLDDLRRGCWSEETMPIGSGERRHTITIARERFSACHAALARVHYSDGHPSTMLMIVKPALTGGEPADLLEYHGCNADFPQQTTLDQFFDEAQWESYRKLGEHIGNELFGKKPPAGGDDEKPKPKWFPVQL